MVSSTLFSNIPWLTAPARQDEPSGQRTAPRWENAYRNLHENGLDDVGALRHK